MEIVCKQWTENFEIYGYHIEDILSLIKDAYRERAKEGISFDTLNYTIEDFLAERTDADYWFLAFDEDHRLYGTARLTMKDKTGEICNFAVSPQSQGKHVGAQLLQAANKYAESHKLDYVMSYTAMNAASSVNCHLHNGYRIVEIFSYLDKNYSSYAFRCQLSSINPLSYRLMTYSRYLKSFVLYKLKKRSNGQNTLLGDYILSKKKGKV